MLIKAFRLFVSSTFADFASERDILQREVFPALDSYCAARGYQFYPLDLRWGVNEEAQLDHRTTEICLGEVRAAKEDYPPPNFLIMVGNRYGLVPLPYAVAQDEFEAILAWLEGHDQQDAARALGSVYRYDANQLMPPGLSGTGAAGGALIGAYTLLSRLDELPELGPAEAWAQREAELRTTLQEAADALLALGRIDDATHEKYFLSLTDQEIICGLPGYRSDEDRATLLSGYTNAPSAIAFVREIVTESGTVPTAIRHYFEQESRLAALKAGIKRALPENHVVSARVAVGENGRLPQTYLADFAAQIQTKLKSAIDQHIARVETVERSPDFAVENERAAHRAFAERKLEIFVGRKDALAAIARYLEGVSDRPLVLHGRSGLGKSALMARALAAAEIRRAPVIARFIGASAASSNARSLLISIIEDLAAHSVVSKPAEFEQDASKFNAQIAALLSSLTAPTIVFLDALDQLQKPYNLGWVPAKLPNTLKLVCSVIDDTSYELDSSFYRNLRERVAPEAFVEIGPLDVAQGRQILSALEGQSRHRLQEGQRAYVIEKYENAGCSPLYLKTAFEIVRGWRSYHTPGIGRHVLADDTHDVIAQFLAELSSVHHHEPDLISRTLGYLAAAKHGLSTKELTEILSRDVEVMQAIWSERHGAVVDKLPASVWVRLHRDLSPFIVEKQIDEQPLLQFFHRQIAEVARQQHYEPVRTQLHAALAGYFDSRSTNRNGRAEYDKRSLSELPYQLHRAGDTARLSEILMSPNWMQQKLVAFGPGPLVDDYQYARSSSHKLIHQTLQLVMGILGRDPRQLLPQLHDRLMSSNDTSVQSFCFEARQQLPRPSILTLCPSLTPPGGAEIARLEGHRDSVMALVVLSDGRLASGGWDNTIRLWDLGTGAETAQLQGHTGPVTALAVLPDGRLASGSGSHSKETTDNTIRLWDITTEAENARLEGHSEFVSKLVMLPDGRLASASTSGDDDNRVGTIRLWDITTGVETARIDTSPVSALVVLPDGRLASGSYDDKRVRLWDTSTGTEIARLDGYIRVCGMAVLPDGRLATGTHAGTIRLWDTTKGAETMRLRCRAGMGHISTMTVLSDGRLACLGSDHLIQLWDAKRGIVTGLLDYHTEVVTALSPLPDGRLASGSSDGTIRLWNPNDAAGAARIERHHVTELAALPDGRLVSGSADGTILLWDRTTRAETASLEGHSKRVYRIAALPDGRLASLSDDGTIRVWDPDAGAETARINRPNGSRLAVLPHGRLASGTNEWKKPGIIQLWDPNTGAEIGRLEGHSGPINALTVLPDGRLASGSGDPDGTDCTIRLWQPPTGTETARFELDRRGGQILELTVLPDGRLASSSGTYGLGGSEDHNIRLWDITTGTETARFNVDFAAVNALAVLPDGRFVSGSSDRTIRLWDVKVGEIARLEIEAPLSRVVALSGGPLVACDNTGRMHWLTIVE
jgi:WD40 repeat protein